MSFKAFLDGYHAARNGPDGRTERLEQSWQRSAAPEWLIEPSCGDAPQRGSAPAERKLAELLELLNLREAEVARLKDERWRDLDECETLRREIAARDAELAECRAVIAELWAKNEENAQRLDAVTAELARVTATRDRYQTNGKAAAAARDAGRERIAQLEAVLGFPGVKKALLKSVHPDMHPQASASERRALDEMSRTVNAVYDSMEPKA